MSSIRPQYSHLEGNSYARKYNNVLDNSLSLRCNSLDKIEWLKKAENEGKSLNMWVIETLNKTLDRIED